MLNLINWAEVEKITGWGEVMGDGSYNEKWDELTPDIIRSMECGIHDHIDEGQVLAMHLSPDETVLDACCGLGRLSLHMARRAKHVLCLDAGKNRLEVLRRNAQKQGLENITTLCINWNFAEPGVDFEKQDVVIGCNCPALADIAKFSRAAKKRCIYLHGCRGPLPRLIIDDLYRGTCDVTPIPQVTVGDEEADSWNCSRNSFPVTFNRLISLGAAPTVNYCEGGWFVEAKNEAELLSKIRSYKDVPEDKLDILRSNISAYTVQTPGGVAFERKHTMVIMEWDPNEVRQEV